MSITYKENSSLPSIENYTSIGIGSGLGTSEKSIAIIQALFPQTSIPLILDADALNIISLQLELLEELPKGSLLTPHPKEFDRLFGESKNSFERHMKQLSESKKHGIYILLKGKHTCISSPEGESYFNLTGNAGMAKGGSGDVLTGIITALFAQYKNMLQAAILGVYLHGLAGDLTLNDQSQESMLASDLIEHLGNAFASFDTSL
jgi:NAD(P)H-hydrate epimerase